MEMEMVVEREITRDKDGDGDGDGDGNGDGNGDGDGDGDGDGGRNLGTSRGVRALSCLEARGGLAPGTARLGRPAGALRLRSSSNRSTVCDEEGNTAPPSFTS